MQKSKIKNQNYNSKSKTSREAGHQIFDFCFLSFDFARMRAGFSVVEVLVGVSLIAIFLIGVSEAARFSIRVTGEAESRLQATFLLEEGIEVAKGLRDSGWTANIVPPSLDTDYWPVWNAGSWTLNSSPQPFTDGRFDRRVRVSAVRRDALDDIVGSGGTIDPDTKRVTVNVSWSLRGATTTATLSTYITNLFNN